MKNNFKRGDSLRFIDTKGIFFLSESCFGSDEFRFIKRYDDKEVMKFRRLAIKLNDSQLRYCRIILIEKIQNI